MKTSCLIRNILLAGTISLTLASCGGGGGGGGDSSSTGSSSGSTSENTQQEKVEMPQQLTSSMSLTLEDNGELWQFDIKSANQCVDAATGAVYSVNYVRTGAKTATMTITSAVGVSIKINLTLTSANQGRFEMEDVIVGKFTMTGINADSGKENTGEVVVPEDTPSDSGFAPNSLPVGKVLEFVHGSNVIYQYEIVSEKNVVCDGMTCAVVYSKTDENSAKLIVKAEKERVWELSFLDEERGNAQYNSEDGVFDSYTFRISDDGTFESPSDDSDVPEVDEDSGDSDDNDVSGENDEPNRKVVVEELAPRSLPVGSFIKIKGQGFEYCYKIVSDNTVNECGTIHRAEYNQAGTRYEYLNDGTEKQITDQASFKVVSWGESRTWELTFVNKISGRAQYSGQYSVFDGYTFQLTSECNDIGHMHDNNVNSDDEDDEDDEDEKQKIYDSFAGKTICLQGYYYGTDNNMYVQVGKHLSSGRYEFVAKLGSGNYKGTMRIVDYSSSNVKIELDWVTGFKYEDISGFAYVGNIEDVYNKHDVYVGVVKMNITLTYNPYTQKPKSGHYKLEPFKYKNSFEFGTLATNNGFTRPFSIGN